MEIRSQSTSPWALLPEPPPQQGPISPSLRSCLIGIVPKPVLLPNTTLYPFDFSPTEFEITCIPIDQKPLLQVPCTAVDFLRPRPPLGVQIVINLQRQRLILMRYEKVILESPISSGRPGYRTTPGKFEVTQKDLHHFSTLYGYHDALGRYHRSPMKYFVRYNGAEGLHAGDLPGYPASHGCVRLPASKAAVIFKAVGVGTPVTVVTGISRGTPGETPQSYSGRNTRNTRMQNGISSTRKAQARMQNAPVPIFRKSQTASF